MNSLPGSRTRILIVDRNEDLRELFSYFLELKGFDVRAVPDGEIALICAAAFAPHAVFSSLRIGEPDGYMLARQLRLSAQTRTAVLVAMSAYAHESAEVYGAGFDHYLPKPIAFESLMAIIEPLAAKRHPGLGSRP
jgi:DNA-binding response OmpR family regulator